jgi:ATP-dependent helicase Lhr and Lhr-like helicase
MGIGRSAFERLDPTMQQRLYDMGWTALRPIQVEAIHTVLDTPDHLVIAARTASGKTEAAFLPILSLLAPDPGGSIRALYVGPLRALINDQFRRLEDLCERSGINVQKWHGDVGAAARRTVLRAPSGVLLITPESIESLLINHPQDLPRLFAQLQFAVIDELHAFIGTERGAHMQSLLARVARYSARPVRLIGLSATLGEPAKSVRWLAPRPTDTVHLITDPTEQKEVRLVIKTYVQRSRGRTAAPNPADDQPEETDDLLNDHLAADLYQAFRDKAALIFTNSRTDVERYADALNRRAEQAGVLGRFRAHHGSLARGIREETEEALRATTPTAALCTGTLELGIDIGNVASIGQIGPPWSVNSLAQRLGRSGRHDGEASELWMFVEEPDPSQAHSIVDRLAPKLLHAVALVELLLERWCEPPDLERLHVSTLVQQILSVIAQTGAAPAGVLFDLLVGHGPFRNVDQATFVQVLRSMGQADLIEQAPEGPLILGLSGERTVRSLDFYAVFMAKTELRVVAGGRAIGTVVASPNVDVGTHLILAGRRWKILEIDARRHEVLVEPSRAGRVPRFQTTGSAEIHGMVRQKMRDVLRRDDLPAYLDARGRQMLVTARATARETQLLRSPWFVEGAQTAWFTWTGSRINRTLLAIGRHVANLEALDEGIALVFSKSDPAEIQAAYAEALRHPPAPEALAATVPVKATEKYEGILSDALQTAIFAHNSLDVPGALALMARDLRSQELGAR